MEEDYWEEDYWKDKDGWFDANFANEITPEFAKWWWHYYNKPEDYHEMHEYFIRMAFAWRGWQAGKKDEIN